MLTTEKNDQSVIIKPQGKITAANVDEFRQDLLDIVSAGDVNLIIDLAGVEMIDSKGLAIFVVCHKTVSEQGGSLTVVTDNQDLLGLFHLMRLDKHFKVIGSDQA